MGATTRSASPFFKDFVAVLFALALRLPVRSIVFIPNLPKTRKSVVLLGKYFRGRHESRLETERGQPYAAGGNGGFP